MKRIISIVALLGLMIPTLVYAQGIKLVVNGEQVKMQVAPIKNEGVTMVPLKVIAVELGAETYFDSISKKVMVIKKDKIIELPIGQNIAVINGATHTLNTPPIIINGTTMVPIRFIAEHLECVTIWDYENNTVIVKSDNYEVISTESEIQPPKEFMDEAIKILENKITFTNDIEVFTLYAFMNYTGYTEENNKQGFSPVRKSVLEDLKCMDLKLRDENYYTNTKVNAPDYMLALKHMDKAPYFNYKKDLPNGTEGLRNLPKHLQEFYKEANIEELYKKYQKEYQKEQDKYTDVVCPAIARINYYLKIDSESIKPFVVNINLLEAYWRGYGLDGKGYYYNGYDMILTGPSDEPNVGNIVHEYLHRIISPIVRNLEEVNTLDYLRSKVPTGSQADGYGNWKAILDESIIRGISDKAVDCDAKYKVNGQYNEGFILAPYFYERFDEFKEYDGSLEEFIKKLIVEYK